MRLGCHTLEENEHWVSSGLLLQEAPVMIAEERKVSIPCS